MSEYCAERKRKKSGKFYNNLSKNTMMFDTIINFNEIFPKVLPEESSELYYLVKRGKKYGTMRICKRGNLNCLKINKIEYDTLNVFIINSEVFYSFSKNKHYGLLNDTLSEILKPKYQNIIYAHPDFELPSFLVKSNGKWGIMSQFYNISGTGVKMSWALNPDYDTIILSSTNPFCKKDEKWCYAKFLNGCKYIITANCFDSVTFSHKYLCVKGKINNEGWGLYSFYSGDFELIIPPVYDEITSVNYYNLSIVRKNGLYGVFEHGYGIILNPEYDSIKITDYQKSNHKSYQFEVTKNGVSSVIEVLSGEKR
jgi:hypothetical protein